MVRLVIIADDLTGAADAVGGYAARYDCVVAVGVDVPSPPLAAADIIVIDTETRHTSAAAAALRVQRAVRAHEDRTGATTFKKIDSLLRGNVGAEVVAATRASSAVTRVMAVVAPAFPAAGRSTRGGIVHVRGKPYTGGLHRGDVVAAVAAAGVSVQGISGPIVRRMTLTRQLEAAYAAGAHAAVVDAATDDDLEEIARASEAASFPALLVGSAGLAAHAMRGRREPSPRPPRAGVSRVLVVVGSHTAIARAQVRALGTCGTHHREVDVAAAPPYGRAPASLPAGGDVVVTPPLARPVDIARASDVARALAATAKALAPRFGALVLTGGETAKAVVDALGIRHLRVLDEIEPGVMLCRSATGAGPLIVTKAGAFGDEDALVRAVDTVKLAG